MTRSFFLLGLLKSAAAIGLLLIVAQPGQATDNPLTLFKNYFITGDYEVGGVGLRGKGQLDRNKLQYLAAGTISVPVPPNADILAAFLYWETIEKTILPSSVKGYLLAGDFNEDLSDSTSAASVEILGKPLGAEHAAPCWSSGGSTGSSNGTPTLRVYRGDVLRYLKVNKDTGKKVLNIKVWLPDSGSSGGAVPLTEGASLVVVYRDPTLNAKFKGVVIFDGSFTMNNSTDSLNQTINGFYQASTTDPILKTGPIAKVTHIVGDGQLNFPERLWFGTTEPLTQLDPTNPSPFA